MLDTHMTQKQHLKFNAVSGSLIKSCEDSFILRFHLKSKLSAELLDALPMYRSKPVVILQMLVVGDMEVLCELIYKADYEKLYEVAE